MRLTETEQDRLAETLVKLYPRALNAEQVALVVEKAASTGLGLDQLTAAVREAACATRRDGESTLHHLVEWFRRVARAGSGERAEAPGDVVVPPGGDPSVAILRAAHRLPGGTPDLEVVRWYHDALSQKRRLRRIPLMGCHCDDYYRDLIRLGIGAEAAIAEVEEVIGGIAGGWAALQRGLLATARSKGVHT